jgi:hypothetical protein
MRRVPSGARSLCFLPHCRHAGVPPLVHRSACKVNSQKSAPRIALVQHLWASLAETGCLKLLERHLQDAHGFVIMLGPDILLATLGRPSPLLELRGVGVVS